MNRSVKFIAGVMLAAAPLTALYAQGAPRPGMVVKDSAGGTVGTVIRTDAGMVTVKTNKHEIPLSAQSFTVNGNSLLFGMTQAQLDAEYEKGVAAAQSSLQVGLPVKGAGGNVIGKIEAIDATNVTIKLSGGDQKIVIPRSGIAGSAAGATIGLTDAEIDAQVSSGKSE